MKVHVEISLIPKCYAFRPMTKNDEVIAENPFQSSGVTRRLWTYGRLELTLVVNTSFYFDIVIAIQLLINIVSHKLFHLTQVITDRMSRRGKLPVLNLLTGQKSGFSPRRGESLHRFTSNLAGPTGTWVRLPVQYVTSFAADGGNAAQTNIKSFHSFVKSRPCGATPLTDFENY